MQIRDYPSGPDRGIRGRVSWGQPPQRIHVLAAGAVAVRRWPQEMAPLPCWRCYQNLEGRAQVGVRGQAFVLDRDHVVVVAPGAMITTRHVRSFRQLFAHVWQPGRPAGGGVGVWRLAVDEVDAALAEDLCRRFAAGEADRPGLVAATAAWCLRILARLPQETAVCYTPHVQLAIDHLLDNLHRPVPSRELATLVGMHPASFTRSFRQQTGEPPQRWHHRARLDAACLAMLQSESSIEQVAIAYGYHDRHHFTRVFTRTLGVAPATWRRMPPG